MSGYLIILGAGPDQIPSYIEAQQLGIKIIAVDFNPGAPGLQYADVKVLANIKNKQETIRELKALNMPFLGVTTLGVEISPVVAAVAKEFGLTAVSEETAYLTTNKCARNQVLAGSNIPLPAFQIVESSEDIDMPLPFVIKPSDNSASRGVRRVDEPQDIPSAFEIARDFASDRQVLVEELLSGPEISIEGFMLDRKMYVTGFADRNYRRNPQFYPFFVEDGGESPSVLPEDTKQEAKAVFEQAALALGITNGPSKGDLIVTTDGVKVLEVTSRLSGGGFCSRIVPLESGINIVRATVKWASGLEVTAKELEPQWKRYVINRFFFHKPGRIREIRGLDKVRDLPGIADFVIQRPFKAGDILEPVNYANRLFYVVSVAGDRDTAIKYAEDAINSVEIVVE